MEDQFLLPKGMGYNIPFNIWKLRTMKVNSEKHRRNGPQKDPRITSIGKFLQQDSMNYHN